MLACWIPLMTCILLSVLYVGSLYIWDSSKGRDHPSTIKKRCISVAFMSLLSPVFVKLSVSQDAFLKYNYPSDESEFSLLELMGLRLPGLGNALIFPLMLTMLFYTGPIIFWMCHEQNFIYFHPKFLSHHLSSLVWLRNQVIAPFSEEWTFRACLLPILLQCMNPTTALFVAPLFFGLAHLHHAVGKLKLGFPILTVILATLFQCLYTSVFGMYSAYIYMKTGHFAAVFITHSFCNLMGVPDLIGLLRLPFQKRLIHICLHVTGIVLWYFALPSLMEGCRYSAVVHYLPDL